MPHRIRKLAIVGASARAAAFSALRAGYEVVTADLFADADLQTACPAERITGYPEALATWLAATPCDAWMYTGALENHSQLVDRMATLKPLVGNGGLVLRQVRDPLWLQRQLGDAGLAFPETTASPVGLPLDGSWLCKTYRGAGGAGVWLLDGDMQLMRAARSHAYFQRYVAGLPAAATFVVYDGHSVLLGVTRQLLGPDSGGVGRWRYRGSIGRLSTNSQVARQLDTLGELLAHRFQLRGLVGVDVMIDADRVWTIEINPRYTASSEIVEQFCGASAVAMHVAACTEASEALPTVEIQPAASTAVDELTYGKAVLFARKDVVMTESFFRWALERTADDPARRELADVPPAGAKIPAGSPVLTAFASGRDCEKLLGQRLAEVERRLYAAPPPMEK